MRPWRCGWCSTASAQEDDLTPADGECRLVATRRRDSGAARAVPRRRRGWATFAIREMRQFARRAIEILARQKFRVRDAGDDGPWRRLRPGYRRSPALADPRLPARADDAPAAGAADRSSSSSATPAGLRCCTMRWADVELVLPTTIAARPAPPTGRSPPAAEPQRKKSVFVAMPFAEEFEDIYQFGIYAAVRRLRLRLREGGRIGLRRQHRRADHRGDRRTRSS